MRALTALKTGTEPAGMLKLVPRLRSMMVAWLMKKVDNCANEIDRAMVDAHTGRILIKHLNSSTCVTVHSFQRLFWLPSGSVTTAALSKNLQDRDNKQIISIELLEIYTYILQLISS